MAEVTAESLKIQLTTIDSLPTLSSPLENAKRAASYKAMDQYFLPLLASKIPEWSTLTIEEFGDVEPIVIGIGSGSTVVYAAERLGEIKKTFGKVLNDLNLICVATGFQSENLILHNKLRLGTIAYYPKLALAFDGADECDPQLNCIKGGGACLLQEKLVALSAEKFVIVADDRKKVPHLSYGWKIPIEVVNNAPTFVEIQLKKVFGDALKDCIIRESMPKKAGAVVTDNFNCIMDINIGPVHDVKKIHEQLKNITGVVETGLFPNVNCVAAYFGNSDGSVEEVFPNKS
ncbi:hypothetical protein FOG51_01944 [Hanseniaspora uvarum]|nr:hypothetical protein FOG51_01944 [Hanseniaspora uvarum]KAF0277635.1 hypothetical protein FOG50_01516 [Hanseniaspora uvarum]